MHGHFFFPVPPDLMIVPMVVARREEYIKIFLIATVGSVLGGLFGYMLGVLFLDVSMVIIEFYGYEEKYLKEALKSTWISDGRFLTRLEKKFSNYLDNHCFYQPRKQKIFYLTTLNVFPLHKQYQLNCQHALFY